MLLEVLMLEKEAVWSLWQAAAGESQCSYLGFWSKAVSFIEENYIPFEK